MGYTPADHAIAYLNTMSVAELVLPSSTTISSSTSAGSMGKVGINALTGLGGYMVSLASKTQKPSVIQLAEGEVLVTKESTLVLFKYYPPWCVLRRYSTDYHSDELLRRS